jgi:hypothetical protein
MNGSLTLTTNQFNPNPYWDMAIIDKDEDIFHDPSNLDLFDQNGYRLTELEQYYATANYAKIQAHRYEVVLRQDWLYKPEQTLPFNGPHLNHSFLFERKGYIGEALSQLEYYAKSNFLLYKLINIRPKWGIDFSMDYTDESGNSFEVLHYEYDGFDHEEINDKKKTCEDKFINIDWDFAAQHLIKHKSEWHQLDFFAQSAWKCDYFGLPDERFKEVLWK